MNDLLMGLLAGIVLGAIAAFGLFKADWRRTVRENLTMRANILAIRTFDDIRLAKEALGYSPIPTLAALPDQHGPEAAGRTKPKADL